MGNLVACIRYRRRDGTVKELLVVGNVESLAGRLRAITASLEAAGMNILDIAKKTLGRGSSALLDQHEYVITRARMSDIQMLACPFCGNDDPVLQEIDDERWAVCCEECGTIGPHQIDNGDEVIGEKAIEFWNMRAA